MMNKTRQFVVGSLALTLLLSVAFEAKAAQRVKKFAVLVGIGKYKMQGISNLNGPRKDVQKMKRFLRRVHGFTHIKVLTDAQATKANIVAAMRWLARKAGPNSPAVFYFSGHGSRVNDTNGDEKDDNLDETLVPYDVGPAPSSHIIDDEIYAWIKTVRSRKLTIILDSCHSGTGYKSLNIGVQNQLSTAMKAKYWPNPYLKSGLKTAANKYDGVRRIIIRRRDHLQQANQTVSRPEQRQYFTFIAASQASEFAYDVGGQIDSILTHYLIYFGSRYPRDSVQRLVQRINRALRIRNGLRRWAMTPNAEGHVRQPLFFSQEHRRRPQLSLRLSMPTTAKFCRNRFCATLKLLNKNGYPTSQFYNGQEVMFSFKLNRPGYVAIIGEDAKGHVTLLFPDYYYQVTGSGQMSYRVKQTRWYLLPPGGKGSLAYFQVKGKSGSVESVSLIASSSKADFLKLYKKRSARERKEIIIRMRDRHQRRMVSVKLKYRIR